MKPLFQKGETLRHKSFPAMYLVKNTPDRCTYNGEPAYLLQQLHPHTSAFYRKQEDVEQYWETLYQR